MEKILLLRGKRKEVDWLKFLMIEIRISICLTYFAQDGGFDRFILSLERVDMQYLRTSLGISRESLFSRGAEVTCFPDELIYVLLV